MENIQTAVEWLLQRFEDGDMYNVEDAQFIKHQAKEMEKHQIIDAHYEGQCNNQEGFPKIISIKYYEENYGN